MWAKAVISGEKRNAAAIAARSILTVLAWLYRLVIAVRNRLYDNGWLPIARFSVPIVCIGNITVGGTGKTPMVVWVCRYLQERGRKVVVLSRGYKKASDDNDETRMLRRVLPSVPMVVDGDRVRGVRTALARYEPEVIVLDDGFQHRRLGRDLDIITIDCTCPFGYGHLLPRGLLREPVSQLGRAAAVVLTRSDLVAGQELDRLTQQVERIAGAAVPIAYSHHEPVGLYDVKEKEVPLAELQSRRAVLFCGIGNPESFVAAMVRLGVEVAAVRFFSDHYHYQARDCETLKALARENNAELLVTTEKDWVKLAEIEGAMQMEGLHWLRVEAQLSRGYRQLSEKLDSLWQE